MLRQLIIDNVALIEHLEIAFPDGFCVLTGETGAGKSIIIEALNFVLGERANRDLIQSGAAKACVEANFFISQNDFVQEVLKKNELDLDDDELVLFRELSTSGKNVCRINGTLVSAAVLKDVGDALVDIHGQHAHQSLLNPRSHMQLLDAFGGEKLLSTKEKTVAAYRAFINAKELLDAAVGNERDKERRCDLLSYQLKEIDAASLVDGEEEELLSQRKKLQNSQLIMESLGSATELLSGESGVLPLLTNALRSLDAVTAYYDECVEPTEHIRESYYSVEDAAFAIRNIFNDFSYEPDALDKTEWRLETISGLKRKYGATITEILAYRAQIEEEYNTLINSEAHKEELRANCDAARHAYFSVAATLSSLRKNAASALSKRIIPELMDLGIPNATFEVSLHPLSENDATVYGIEQVEFLLSTNKGEPVKPLTKVASGGEISRIMLAFKSVFAENDHILTMVFDEIDTGISGQIGNSVAIKMRQIAQKHQVLCITHLPQIAAYAQAQYLVYKETFDGRTHSTAVLLDNEERCKELARIMGSSPDDPIAVRHAQQLIDAANQHIS